MKRTRQVDSEAEGVVTSNHPAGSRSRPTFGVLHAEFEKVVFQFVFQRTRDQHKTERICNEVWLKVDQKLGTLDPSREAKNWLLTIADNQVNEAYRKAKTKKRGGGLTQLPLEAVGGTFENEPGPLEILVRKEQKALLEAATEQLSASDQELVTLLRHGCTRAEIAEELGKSLNAVYIMITRVHGKLKRNVKQIARSKAEDPGGVA